MEALSQAIPYQSVLTFIRSPAPFLEILAEDQMYFHENSMDPIVSHLLVPGMAELKTYIT